MPFPFGVHGMPAGQGVLALAFRAQLTDMHALIRVRVGRLSRQDM